MGRRSLIGENVVFSLKAMADFMLPRSCLVCGRRLNVRENHLCIYCEADIPFTYFWRMARNLMGDRLNVMLQRYVDGTYAFLPPMRYAGAAALFHYKGSTEYRKIPRSLKYEGNLSVGHHYGKMLGRFMHSSGLYDSVDVVIPVPLSLRRRLERGYNQAYVVAKAIASEFGVSHRGDLLMRQRHTKTQTRLAGDAKARNVLWAFKALSGKGLESYRHILLVDDVFTTGATTAACIAALYQVISPVTRVSVATLGFVTPD